MDGVIVGPEDHRRSDGSSYNVYARSDGSSYIAVCLLLLQQTLLLPLFRLTYHNVDYTPRMLD